MGSIFKCTHALKRRTIERDREITPPLSLKGKRSSFSPVLVLLILAVLTTMCLVSDTKKDVARGLFVTNGISVWKLEVREELDTTRVFLIMKRKNFFLLFFEIW